jgi:hypothetical protein
MTGREDTNARTLVCNAIQKGCCYFSYELVMPISYVLLGAGLNGASLGLIFALIFSS